MGPARVDTLSNDSDISVADDHAGRIRAEPFLIQLKGGLSQRKGAAINSEIHHAGAEQRHQDELSREGL